MKRMKRLALALLAICLLAALPAAVMAEETDYIYVGGNKLYSGMYMADKSTKESKEKPATGGYAYYKDGVLELNNYSLSYAGNTSGDPEDRAVIFSRNDLTIELKGSNSLKNTGAGSEGSPLYGIYISDYDDETLIVKGEGSLAVTVDDNSVGIFCNSDVDVLGGTLKVKGGGNGILSDGGSISISSGTVTADGGIAADKNLTISGGTVEAADIDADEMTISGGTVKATGDGIGADKNLTISGGTVEAAGYGIFAEGNMTIKGGTVKAAGIFVEENITISGGALKVDGAILALSSINIDPPMQIVTPAGGTVGKYKMGGEDYGAITILNPNGEMAMKVYIAAVTAPADLPQTGDASRIGLWLALGLVSCAGLIMAKRRTA